MEHLPYDLDFMHKYNLHKWMGFDIDDNDLKFISAIYGVKYRELRKVEDVFAGNIEKAVSEIAGQVQIRPLQKPYTIAAVGDSISSDRQSWVKILNRLWKGQRRIIDCAISGDTTSDLIDRFYGTIMNEDFQWAVLFIGTNDCRELDDGSHMTQIGFEEYKLKMNYIMDRFQKAGKRVVNVTLPPVDPARLKSEFPENLWTYDAVRIDKTNDFIRQLSKKSKSLLADLAKAIETHDGDVLEKDGLHLNAEGQVILCRLLLELLP
jgi:lysophospholipase L1-like esterase